jgi:hypothetical protein
MCTQPTFYWILYTLFFYSLPIYIGMNKQNNIMCTISCSWSTFIREGTLLVQDVVETEGQTFPCRPKCYICYSKFHPTMGIICMIKMIGHDNILCLNGNVNKKTPQNGPMMWFHELWHQQKIQIDLSINIQITKHLTR